MLNETLSLASLLAVPLLLVLLDLSGSLRAACRHVLALSGATSDDFEVLVPIYGSVRYLENIDFLAPYGSKVILCTTSGESAEFDRALDTIAVDHGFRVFRSPVDRSSVGTRSTSGVLRDTIVRDAHAVVTATYVICLDADTVTGRPLGEIVGAMSEQGYDVVSVRLVPSNGDTVLARLQAHEYRAAMLLRRLIPWLVSGACHAATAGAHKAIMDRHSLFFQGNDVEVGVLADALGYRVGHLPVDVPTTVPSSLRAWWRQRLAWAGGEARIFLVNPQLAVRHPFFWLGGAVLTIGLAPLRWMSMLHPGWALLGVPLAYLVLLLHLHRGHWDRWLPLIPLYALLSSLVLTPLGLLTFAQMAWRDRNVGRMHLPRARIGQVAGGAAEQLPAWRAAPPLRPLSWS